MQKVLYIGIYSAGSTSKMRADKIGQILTGWNFSVIDTDVPFNQQPRLFQTLGFRYKKGPLIKSVNTYIREQLKEKEYDLIWVDKAIYLTKATTELLRQKAKKLVHFTPDTAFLSNRSTLFNQSMSLYDYLVTTKNFELSYYHKVIPKNRLLRITQGYDRAIHKPYYDFNQKTGELVFIGLCEPSREQIIQQLIDNDIQVILAGRKWGRFVQRNTGNENLRYIGPDIWDSEYTRLISSCYFSLGLLSKRFPELHTTRTFEIPACGTALLTERNEETGSFYTDDEVIFFDGIEDLVKKIKYYRKHLPELAAITAKGTQKVNQAGFDYESILRRLLRETGVPSVTKD